MEAHRVNRSRTIAIIYARFGPYHVARLNGAQAILSPEGWQVLGIEVVPDDRFSGKGFIA